MKSVYSIFSICAIFVLIFSSHSSGPQAGVSGAPGELTCSTTPGCHNGGTFTGTVVISGVPDTVLPNTNYTITITSNSTKAVKGGFEITCLDNANVACGTLAPGTGSQLITGNSRQYIGHSSPKVFASGNVAWTFTWTSPATLIAGPITFYAAGNLCNGDGDISGDNAITGNKKVVFKKILSPTTDLISEEQIMLSPNPTSEIMTIQFQQNTISARLSLIDLSGKNVLHQNVSNNTSINVGNLPRGLYFARFIIGENSVVKKIELN